MVSRSALVRYPVAGTPTEVRQIDVLAGGDVAGFASSPDSCRTHSVSLGTVLVMVLVVRNGARAADVCLLERDCAAAHSLDALESIDLFLAVILRAAWLLQRHEDWTHDEK